MQAAVLQTALSPISGAAARAGMTGEPGVDAPDFGQELLAATARADENAVPLVPGSTAGRTPPKGPPANDRVPGASAIPLRAPDASQATAAAAGDQPDSLPPATKATRLASAGQRMDTQTLQRPAQAAQHAATRLARPVATALPARVEPDDAARPADLGAPARLHHRAEPVQARATTAPDMGPSSPATARPDEPPTGAATPSASLTLPTRDHTDIARMPADAGTVTVTIAPPLPQAQLGESVDPMQTLPQRLAHLAADGVETARIDLDLASAAPVEVRMTREGGQVRVDLTSSDPQVRERLEQALPSVAAALHAAGLKLADGGVHARLPDALRVAHPARAAQDPKAIDFPDALPATEGLDASTARSATPEIETTGVNAQAAAGGIDQDTPRREALHGSAAQMLPQTQADADPAPQPAGTAVLAPSVDARAARTVDTPANRTDPRVDGVSSKPRPARSHEPLTATHAPPAGVSAEPPTRTPATGTARQRPAAEARPQEERQQRIDQATLDRGPQATTEAQTPGLHQSTEVAARTTGGASEPAPSEAIGASSISQARKRVDQASAPDARPRAVVSAAPKDLGVAERTPAREAVADPRQALPEPAPRAPLTATAAEWAQVQSSTTTPNAATLMAAMPEGRMTRTGAPASTADGLPTTARAAPSRREPLAPRADLQAAAMMQLPPSVLSLPASPSPASQGVPSPWLDAVSRALDMTASPLPRDGDASALAAGALPTAAADASFSAALEAAGSTIPEFMLREALDSADFTPALSARIATMVRDGIEEARIQLNPADMGPVAVQLAMEGSDVRVDLAAEVESTRQILEQALPSLASALRESGFTLTGGGVFQQPRDPGHGDRGPSDGRNGTSRAEATGETVTTVSTASTGRAPRRGLVDLYA